MMNSDEIRRRFLEFFRERGHQILPSAPIVLKNDPTLLFTNAGMNQFKDYFLGNQKPPYPRVADTQKCLRVSGKHNDLEEVGVDTYHHTMFEMLGNWSFGDYFKNEAIEFSWELLTKEFNLPKDRLYATVFEGDEKEKLPASTIALAKWRQFLPDQHIVYGNKKDNFWEMGDTGPCGPCSEIHIDLRTEEEILETPGYLLVNKDHPQVIEIWNNVFIQFNRMKDGSLEPLPSTHVDTGMGFERLVRAIQNKKSNYDTDVFSGTIREVETIVGKQYDGGNTKSDIAFRVLADHIRAISFTIADGQLPSNTGAGYVIRRILRRAVRYYYTYLDYKKPLLNNLVSVLAKQFENVFPELAKQQDFVIRVVKEEEEAFLRTLDKGLKKIDEIIRETAGSSNKTIDGRHAFELYDTYGFPIDLTRLIASEQGLDVDENAFKKEMTAQKDRSRSATSLDTGDWVELKPNAATLFEGYQVSETNSRLLKYRKVTGKGKELYQLVLDQTPFYAESGGQVGDTGAVHFGDETIQVIDTRKENELIIHITEKLPLDPRADIVARINTERRKRIALHHSATHLLHAALREVLGTHVTQKGSLVNDENLRFDFAHFAKLTDDEISRVERIVNQKIRENLPVLIREMQKDEAIALGAMALFGEKYGDMVRVVVIDPSFSVELCGGTHVAHTGELGIFKIRHETAVAAGVRRIEGLSGLAAEEYLAEKEELLNSVKELLKNPKDIYKSLENLVAENSELKKKMEQAETRSLIAVRNDLIQKKETINGIQFIGSIIEISNPDGLKKLCYDLLSQVENLVTVLCAEIQGKPFVAISISENIVNQHQLDAAKLIKEIVAPLIKGGGGGQKTLATAGGQNTGGLQEVINQIKTRLN